MTLSELVHLFNETQAGDKHDVEVSLTDVRTWHSDQQEIMRVNNQQREALLHIKLIIEQTVK